MPIKEREIKRLNNDELLQIIDLPAFGRQKVQFLQELLSRSGFSPNTFRGLHTQPDCNIQTRVIISRNVGCVDPTYNVSTVERRYLVKLVCLSHNAETMEFIDHSLTEALSTRTF